MTERPTSQSIVRREPERASWFEDRRRSAAARFGAAKDFVRDRRGAALAAAVAVLAVSGAGVYAAGSGGREEDHATSIEARVANGEKRLGELGAETKRAEDRLAEVQKRANARESEAAEAEERIAALEKRRESLTREVAELVAPVSPGGEQSERASARDDLGGLPPDESEDAAVSRASVDETDAARHTGDGSDRSAATVDRAALRQRARVEARPASVDEAATAAYDGETSPVRVFIHVRSADPIARERAAAVAAELERRGVKVAQIRGVRLAVRRDTVRFFYDQDRAAVPALQDAVRSVSPDGFVPLAKDLRSYGAPPRRGTIEIWLS